MGLTDFSRRIAAAAFATATMVFGAAANAETLVGSNVDSRVLVGFKVDAADVQAMMPDGWVAIAYPKGPTAGSNLLVSFEDRFLARDAEGKTRPEWNGRSLALLGLGKQKDGDQVRLFVLRVFTSFEGEGVFKNAMAAELQRVTSTGGAASGGRARSESWTITPTGGGEVSLSLAFTSAPPIWADAELRVFSNVDPEISVINRYQQLVDVAMSGAMGKPLSGSFSFQNSVPELADIFDGTEETVAIMDLPVYVREVFLP